MPEQQLEPTHLKEAQLKPQAELKDELKNECIEPKNELDNDYRDEAKNKAETAPKVHLEKAPKAEQVDKKSTGGSLFTFRTDVIKFWRHEASEPRQDIQIAIEQPSDRTTDILVCDHVPPNLLFWQAPLLRNDLYHRRIVLPASPGLDDDVLNDVINAIIDCAKEGKRLAMNMPREPVRMMKIHCVLMRFGMRKEAETLLEALWKLMSSKQLTLGDVLWIWDTFADSIRDFSEDTARVSSDYFAPAANEYVQTMAWQLVNMDAEGRLDENIKKAIEIEQEPRKFFGFLKKRVEDYGLGRQLLVAAAEMAHEVGTGVVNGGKATEIAISTSKHFEASPEQALLTEKVPAYEKPRPSAATTILSDKDLKPSSSSLHPNSFAISGATAQKAPTFTSAGFMHLSQAGEPKLTPPAFGQPERKNVDLGSTVKSSSILKSDAASKEQASISSNSSVHNHSLGAFTSSQNQSMLAPTTQSAPFGSCFSQIAQTTSNTLAAANHRFGGQAFPAPCANSSRAIRQPFGSLSGSSAQNTSDAATASPFGPLPFGRSANDAEANNIFRPQKPASSGGGMVRRFAAAKGSKGARKR